MVKADVSPIDLLAEREPRMMQFQDGPTTNQRGLGAPTTNQRTGQPHDELAWAHSQQPGKWPH